MSDSLFVHHLRSRTTGEDIASSVRPLLFHASIACLLRFLHTLTPSHPHTLNQSYIHTITPIWHHEYSTARVEARPPVLPPTRLLSYHPPRATGAFSQLRFCLLTGTGANTKSRTTASLGHATRTKTRGGQESSCVWPRPVAISIHNNSGADLHLASLHDCLI